MKIFKKFYFWLPAVNIIFLIYDALNRHNNALDILAFPFIYILEVAHWWNVAIFNSISFGGV